MHASDFLVNNAMHTDHENKEDEEDVTEEKYGPQDTISSFQLVKVEVAENKSQKSEDCFSKAWIVFHLSAEKQVAQLSEGEEDNEEHDTETGDVFRALSKVRERERERERRLQSG